MTGRNDGRPRWRDDRVWQAGEAYSKAAQLVEEAAIEAGRAALG